MRYNNPFSKTFFLCLYPVASNNLVQYCRSLNSPKHLRNNHHLESEILKITWTNRQWWRCGCAILITNRTAIHAACMQLSTCKWMTLVGWAQALWQHSTVTFRSNWTDWCQRKLCESLTGGYIQYNKIPCTSRREEDKIKVFDI